MLTPFFPNKKAVDHGHPLPQGMHLPHCTANVQLQLHLGPVFAKRMKRMFGYISEITLSECDGAPTPAQVQVVALAPWRYGQTSIENGRSWIYTRVNAFASKALFAKVAQVRTFSAPLIFGLHFHSVRVLHMGQPVMGFCEPSSGDSKSAQLVGWDVSTPDDWKAMSPNSCPRAWGLNMDAIYATPPMSGESFAHTRMPHVSRGCFCSGPVAGSYALPLNRRIR